MTLILPVLVAVFGILSSVYGRPGLAGLAVADAGASVDILPYGLQGILLARLFNLPMASRLLLQSLESIPASSASFRRPARYARRHFSALSNGRHPPVPPVAALIFMLCFASFADTNALGGGPQAALSGRLSFQALSYDYTIRPRGVCCSDVQMVCCWRWCC
ncbi:hypothetical protein KCP71_01250 [Salmonella enterica subsp. enterica]|nr:hypothetical protein KCP71_01250 [Salmonella enterica subsp. enterica]